MSKSDSWTTKIIFVGLSVIIALLVYIWDDQKSDMAENKTAIAALRVDVGKINTLLIEAGYEKKIIEIDVLSNTKRIEKIERKLP